MFVEVSTRLEYGLIYFPIFTVLKTDKIMTKAAIVNEIFLKMGTDRKEVLQIVVGLMESVKKILANGENVYLRGLDSFVVKHHAEKVVRDITRNDSFKLGWVYFSIVF